MHGIEANARASRRGNAAWRRLVLPTILGLLCGLLRPEPVRAQIAAKDVEAAIDDAVNYLKAKQNPDGTWFEWPGCESGTISLVTLALLNAGVAPDDPVIVKALKYLRTRAPQEKVYAVSLQTMALCAARQDEDLGLIVKNARWLEKAQLHDGSWGYGLGSGGELGDNSNAQFALLALHEAERFSDKVKVGQRVWDKAGKYWQGCQNLDGSWGYRARGESRGTGSMTCAGITSMLITAGKRVDPIVEKLDCCGNSDRNASLERGMDWLKRNFSVQRNPGHAQAWLLYYLYGLERVGRLTAGRFIGEHDWYREGTEKLLRERDRIEGNWVGVGVDEHHPSVATSMALLFLAKGRRPVIVGKLKYGGEAGWNNHPDDASNLVSHIELRWKRDLSHQVLDLRSASVDDLMQVPILYVSGNRDPKFSAEDLKKLREYVLRGGFIFAETCCDGRVFLEAFEDAVADMFKEEGLRLQPLPPEHPVWRMEDTIPPDYVGQLLGLNVSCRTSIIVSKRDLSCPWNHAESRRMRQLEEAGPRTAAVRRTIRDALAVGLNVAAYATNRQVRYKYETFGGGGDVVKAATGRGLFRIAQVIHGGGSDAADGAVPNLQRALAKLQNMRVAIENKRLALTDGALPDFPLLFIHGRIRFSWTDAERKALREYLDRGGVLLADAVCGSREFDESFRDEMAKVFADVKIERIPAGHPLFSTEFGGHDVRQVRRREPQPAAGPDQAWKVQERVVEPQFEGIRVGERWAVLYSPYDISCALESRSAVDCRGYVPDDALKLGVNAVLYSLLQPGP